MKYAVLSGNERFEIREGELKSNGCAVLQVTHVGVCGTDTSYWHEGERYRGVVIGHEYSGVVVAPGTNRASWAIPALTASTPPGSPTVWSSFRIM